MNWETIVSYILVVVLFIVSTILAVKLARKKKPVWAHETTKVIGLGTDAPSELKLTFDNKPVTDVYRTTFIVFNRGNEAIRKDDVITKITVHFSGSDILREPTIKVTSKEETKFSAKRVVKEGNNAIELDFLYLDHHDGAVVEAIHTKCEDIRCLGTIIGTKGIRTIGDFTTSVPRTVRGFFGLIRLMFGWFMLASGFGIFIFGALTSSLAEFWFTRALVPFTFMLAGATFIPDTISYFSYRRFPKWSRGV